MRLSLWFCSLFFLPLLVLPAQPLTKRSFDEIFPGLPAAVRQAAFSNEGYSQSAPKALPADLAASGQSAIDPKIIETVFLKQPGFVVESIMVVPNKTGSSAPAQYSLLDVYNALGHIRGLKGRLYHSHTRNEDVPLFEDVTRIESAKKNNPIPDPAPAARIPPSETIYMRLKDVNFGNSFYRGDMTLVQRGASYASVPSSGPAAGLRYSLSNNKNLTYYFVPVIKEEKFTAQFYFEPISEGILIYGLAGADVSDFVSSRIDMPSAISKRLAVIIGWIAEGITGG